MNFARLGITILTVLVAVPCAAQGLLPSWNEGPAKRAILEFVAAVTDEKDKSYVDPTDRIATFDNDGTLWVEYPMYTQALFAFDRVKELAPQHPEWKTQQPFKGVLEDDMRAIGASGMEGLMEIVMATHSGMTAAEFEQEVSSWLATTKQSKFKRPFCAKSQPTRNASNSRILEADPLTKRQRTPASWPAAGAGIQAGFSPPGDSSASTAASLSSLGSRTPLSQSPTVVRSTPSFSARPA